MKIGKQGGEPIVLKRTTTFGQKIGMVLRIVILIGLIIFLVWSQNNFIVTRDYIYTSQRVPKTFVGYNIVQVSDIHNSSIGVTSAVKRCNPDVIVVTGGLTDDRGNYSNSVKIINNLAKVAPTYYVLGDNDSEYKDSIVASISGAYFIEHLSGVLTTDSISESAFIDKYIGSKIISDANNGDEDSLAYINYTKEKLAADANAYLMISGLAYGENTDTLLDTVYNTIGTDKKIFQICLANQVSIFDKLSLADIDIVFSGETHGSKDVVPGYKKGIYSENGTTCFLSSGIGTTNNQNRVFNYPDIISVTLSDGTIKNENPLEKLLSYFITDVKTKFDDDEGFKSYTYTYTDGRES